jgi:abortive infection bacteriophage resistance protein
MTTSPETETIPFSKPYRLPVDLIEDLKTKHLKFENEHAANTLLSQISYYHFKIYLHPLLDLASPGSKIYRNDQFFEFGVDLYRFDEELRAYLFKVIARLEVKLRSRLDHTLSSYKNDPFWYLDDNLFFKSKVDGYKKINDLRCKIKSDFDNEHELYAKNFREKYHNLSSVTYSSLPPFWIASELLTIGTVFKIYDAIDFSYFKKKKDTTESMRLDNLALEFGASKFSVLTNWVRRLRDVRNRCAHHSRLWNANLATPSEVANLLQLQPVNDKRLYGTIVVMNQMVKTLGIIDLDLRSSILAIISQSPTPSKFLKQAGFPDNWNTDLFWDK